MHVAAFAIGFFVAAIVYAVLGVLTVRVFVRPHVSAGHNEVLLTICQIAGTTYAVLLGFLVVVVWQSYDGAHTNLADEASMLTTIYRQTDGMPATERMLMRRDIRAYTRAVIDDEWSMQAAYGGASTSARHAIADIYRVFALLPAAGTNSAINDDFIRNVSTVAIERNSRTLRASEALPWILWIGLTLGGAVVVGLSFLPRMERVWLHVLACALLAALIGTLLGIAAVLNRPFNGPMALSSAPFTHALQVFDSVDRGS
jgi:hypothetical protein